MDLRVFEMMVLDLRRMKVASTLVMEKDSITLICTGFTLGLHVLTLDS